MTDVLEIEIIRPNWVDLSRVWKLVGISEDRDKPSRPRFVVEIIEPRPSLPTVDGPTPEGGDAKVSNP